jgi:hypothetical protein
MQATIGPGGVVTVTNLSEFFRDALRSVLADQLKTGSARARRLLRRLGVEAAPVALPMH